MEWRAKPRPVSEFLRLSSGGFSAPGSRKNLSARVKCNAYYYRTNYALVLLAALALAAWRNPLGCAAVACALASALLLNDTFAVAFSHALMKAVRRAAPPLAAKIRLHQAGGALQGGGGGAGQRPRVLVLGQDRMRVAAGAAAFSLLLVWWTGAVYTLAFALGGGLTAVLAHAALRTQNFKARLASSRAEFQAMWQSQNTADYTL